MNCRVYLAFLVASTAPAVAQFGAYPTYYVTDGTLSDGSSFSGTYTFDANDTLSGTFTLSDEAEIASVTNEANSTINSEEFDFTNGASFDFIVDPSGPTLCDDSNSGDSPSPCFQSTTELLVPGSGGGRAGGGRGRDNFDATGAIISLTPPPAVTPEPSSLILLGTGAVGIFGRMRGLLTR